MFQFAIFEISESAKKKFHQAKLKNLIFEISESGNAIFPKNHVILSDILDSENSRCQNLENTENLNSNTNICMLLFPIVDIS